MFTMTIVVSDAFLDMPLSSQCLYFHLNMRADDDGFIGNAKRIMRTVGASEDDLKILLLKRFLLACGNGVYVIKHWWMHNTLLKDRYHETQYLSEKSTLKIKQNKSYTDSDNFLLTECQQPVNSDLDLDLDKDIDLDIDKDLDKDKDLNLIKRESIERKDNERIVNDSSPTPKKVKHKYGEYNNVLLTDDELIKLKTEYIDYEERIERLSSYIASKGAKYKSHYATIRNWARRDTEKPTNKTAQMLDDSYAMMSNWAKGDDVVD